MAVPRNTNLRKTNWWKGVDYTEYYNAVIRANLFVVWDAIKLFDGTFP
jgi:hypothetical protein